MVSLADAKKLDPKPQHIECFIGALYQRIGQVFRVRKSFGTIERSVPCAQRRGDFVEVSRSQCGSPTCGKPALDFIELLVLPAAKRHNFRRFVEDDTDTVAS